MAVILSKKLNDIIPFASHARGDYHGDSDIDIMLITNAAEKQVMH